MNILQWTCHHCCISLEIIKPPTWIYSGRSWEHFAHQATPFHSFDEQQIKTGTLVSLPRGPQARQSGLKCPVHYGVYWIVEGRVQSRWRLSSQLWGITQWRGCHTELWWPEKARVEVTGWLRWSWTSWANLCIRGFACLWHPKCSCSITYGEKWRTFLFYFQKSKKKTLIFTVWVDNGCTSLGLSFRYCTCGWNVKGSLLLSSSVSSCSTGKGLTEGPLQAGPLSPQWDTVKFLFAQLSGFNSN